MNGRIKYTLFALLVILTCASFSAVRAQHDNSISVRNEEWTWQSRDKGTSLEMKLRGKVEFNDDYTDVVSISPGGSLRIKDERGGKTHRIEITPSSDGGLTRTYSFNGETRPFTGEAQAWFARFLNEATQQAGLDAAPRARRILSRRGPSGLLDEVSNIHSDYVKKIYFQELIKSGRLDAQTARRMLVQAAREITSDYEKTQTLMKLSEASLDKDGWRAAYIEATRSITSDYERKRALSALLTKGNLSREEFLLAIKSASEMSSDYEKAQVLIKVVGAASGDEAVRNAVMEATKGMDSDYERGRVVKAAYR